MHYFDSTTGGYDPRCFMKPAHEQRVPGGVEDDARDAAHVAQRVVEEDEVRDIETTAVVPVALAIMASKSSLATAAFQVKLKRWDFNLICFVFLTTP